MKLPIPLRISSLKRYAHLIASFVIIGLLILTVYWVFDSIIQAVLGLDKEIAAVTIAVSGTIIVSTVTLVVGRYFERRKEAEAHFRQTKINIYDEFLSELFARFLEHETKSDTADLTSDVDQDELVKFLREWQRKIILWGGQDVVKAYAEWMTHLKKGDPDAKSLLLTEDFFRAMRRDIGHQNWKLQRGTFIGFLLRNPELVLQAAKRNPNIKLSTIADIEEKFEL